ncbi:MAG: hypothetical protein H6706_14130 [Myxococcales bacterium]|nr:hypothetical protein [Myxococcales bacterium]
MKISTLGLLATLAWACSEEVAPADPDSGLVVADAGRTADARPPTSDGPVGPPPKGERSYTLRIDDSPTPPLVLDMDRAEVAQLLGPVADDIVLLELDPTPLLQNIMDAVKTACGTDWQRDVQQPTFDCSQTELGRSFGNRWQFSPEFSLIRVLTMTPANVVVEGTSIEFLQLVADRFDIGGGFGQILSDSLQIARTEEVVTTREVVRSLRENLLETHPNTSAGGRMRVTLRDALNDLSTLEEKLGPVGAHPGILAPGFTPHGEVLGPDFRMRVEARSNIRVTQGLKAAAGRDDINVLVDRTGPTYGDPLEFDFQDPSAFTITGLTPQPTVDMRFAIQEHDRYVPACVSEGCQQNLPDNPVGPNTVWRISPWTLEYVTAYAALIKYRQLRSDNCYIACAATRVSIGQDGAPAGWVHFGVPLELGPKDQYVWEFINEVAEVAMHGPDHSRFEEGEANVEFTLSGVVAGITGPEAAEATRPFLQAQAADLADFILGDFRQRSGQVDFYFRRTSGGEPALFFVIPTDLAADVPYGWRRPGFYSTPDLAPAGKLSSLIVDGADDTDHEKLLITGGEQIAYIEDDSGRRYRLRVVSDSPNGTDIQVHVSEL